MIEPYIVDFYCHEIGLVIELNGGQHNTENGQAYDVERTQFLETLGLTVVQYWNSDVLGRVDVVLEDLWQVWKKKKNTSFIEVLKINQEFKAILRLIFSDICL